MLPLTDVPSRIIPVGIGYGKACELPPKSRQSSAELDLIGIKSGKVKIISPVPAFAYDTPVDVHDRDHHM